MQDAGNHLLWVNRPPCWLNSIHFESGQSTFEIDTVKISRKYRAPMTTVASKSLLNAYIVDVSIAALHNQSNFKRLRESLVVDPSYSACPNSPWHHGQYIWISHISGVCPVVQSHKLGGPHLWSKMICDQSLVIPCSVDQGGMVWCRSLSRA